MIKHGDFKRDGQPVAALVDGPSFDRVRSIQPRFDALANRLAAAYVEVPLAYGLAEIEATVAAVREETRRRGLVRA